MKIRNRITLLFTVITASLLLIFAASIYYSARENREKEFYALLKKEAITKANLLFNAQIDQEILQNIYRNNRQWLSEVEVAIYDTAFNLLYHDAVDLDFVKETPEMIETICKRQELKFYQNGWQVIGIPFQHNSNTYAITAAAYDQYGYNKLNNLLKNSLFIFVLSIILIYLAGRFFSKKAFGPVKEMTDKARMISASHLHLRLTTPASRDELAELARTFNDMMDRLEDSFESQKNFVYHISHELRTPLSAIITELELSLQNNSNVDAYRQAMTNALQDARKLARLLNTLLDLAKASYDRAAIAFRIHRIDEILLDACRQVQQANPSYRVTINFDQDIENEDQISVTGNEYLLKTAFVNLMENGCKFSPDHACTVHIGVSCRKEQAEKPNSPIEPFSTIVLRFEDRGIGIAESDMVYLFRPFYRGRNIQYAEGVGLGLYLSEKIIRLHKGNISVISAPGEGTTFTIELPAITAGPADSL